MLINLGTLIPILSLLVKISLAEIPNCDIFDTVDITYSKRLNNGSYMYKDINIPADLTGEYDTIPGSMEKVPHHLRGCICDIVFCVRFCCPSNQIMKDGKCFDYLTKEAEADRFYDALKEIINDTSEVGIIAQHIPLPCKPKNVYVVNDQLEKEKYSLFRNGTLGLDYYKVNYEKPEICMQNQMFPDGSIRMAPHVCLEDSPLDVGKITLIMISMICLLLTIAVYLYVKKLRTSHGKCFICYMTCLFLGFLILLLDYFKLAQGFCKTAGFLGYFFVMSTFFWLSIISLHLRNKLCGPSSLDRFRTLSVYAWSMALLLTGITYVANENVENPNWNPHVGSNNQCWIKTHDWSAMIYLYGPILCVVVFNISMFVSTTSHIMQVESNYALKLKMKKQLIMIKQTFALLSRLFVIMGISWSFDIISYLVQNNKTWASIFLVADYINCSQGIIIFGLFILKGTTLKLLKERYTGVNDETQVDDCGIPHEDMKSYRRMA
ncbi:G-protein coupled receptor Mth-like [Drosophila eugracilis]|uniref:G-protein coupled receptor Mth-like n=1 Tax=Drosophila eugracilis TaxID=29029 RepID=UPI0007E6C316|nr:G-protein coupled receptor Mth-like [Drosophila eugracilis]